VGKRDLVKWKQLRRVDLALGVWRLVGRRTMGGWQGVDDD
jgi:hypothetical protein